jgi:hypothetical protein
MVRRKLRMKKWVFCLVILLLIGYGVAQHKLKFVNEKPLDDGVFVIRAHESQKVRKAYETYENVECY